MKKSVVFLLLWCMATVMASAQKFALIDTEYILSQIPAYQSANEELDRLSGQWQAEVDKLSKEAKTLYQNYQSTSKSMTEAQKAKKEEEIVAKEKAAVELRRKYFGPEGELAKKRDELMRPIEDDIYEAVKAIATQKGYSVVTDRASANSIIFASPDIDISNEVLRKMGYSK